MRNLVFVILLITLCFSSENTKDIGNEFDSEFLQKQEEIFDPLSGYNRVMTTFNDYFYTYILIPTSKAYAYVIPENGRIAIDNIFNNLMFPVRLTNNLFQLKFQNSLEESERFVINSLWGLGGILDSATKELDIKAHKEDFGQTLGFYGMGEGFPIVLPFLGPSNVRDSIGIISDSYINALSSSGQSDIDYKIPNNLVESSAIKAFDVINKTSLNPNQYEIIKKDALDLYPFLRDFYSQARKKQIEE